MTIALRILTYLKSKFDLLVLACPSPAVNASLEQHQVLHFVAQRRGMLIPMQFILLGTMVLGWRHFSSGTFVLVISTLAIGQIVAFAGYRSAVQIAQNPDFDPKRVSKLLFLILLGIRLSIAIAFSVATYYEQPSVAGACAVSAMLIVVFGSLSTDNMPWSATMVTLLQALVVAVAVYLRYLRDGSPLFEVSLELFLILLALATALSVTISRVTRSAYLRTQLDQIELKNSDRITSAVLNASNEGFAIADLEGKILRANQQFHRLLGSTSNEQGYIQNILPDNILFGSESECEHETQSGHYLTIEQRSTELTDGGNVIVFAVRDQTKNRLVSAENLHNHKIKAIGMLAGGIAHDFNNLIAVIQGNAELIVADSNIPIGQRKSFETIIASTHRASSLTNQLMTLASKQEQKAVTLSADALVQESISIIRPLLGSHITLEVESTTNTRITIIRATFITALLNLMFNARDAMRTGGALRISAVDSDHQTVLFRVSDNGIGISSNIIDKVTQPFFTTKPADQGTGLGLSMVASFVKSSNGHLSIESDTLGGGTHAVIELPAVCAAITEIASRDNTIRQPSRKLNILVIDDNNDFATMLQAQLKQLGHSASTEAALAQVAAREDLSTFDLIICDFLLDGETAITVYDWFRRASLKQAFIFVSGNIPVDDVILLAQKNPFATLKKPVSFNDLRETIDEFIVSRNGSQPEIRAQGK